MWMVVTFFISLVLIVIIYDKLCITRKWGENENNFF